MRLIHTSDWHLGQSFKGFERDAEHQVFLDWLLDTLQAQSVDALLVAGDVFDQANPGAEAQKRFFRFVAQARQRCPRLQIVVIAGNHDSPGRIDAPHPVLDALGVKVVGQYPARAELTSEVLDRVAIPLRDASGRIAAWVLAVPFLRPGDLPRGAEGYPAAVRDAYVRLTEAVDALRQPGQALIAMGHLHIQGAAVSEDSERRLIIGGEEALEPGIFPASLDYVALGHLHKPQTAGADHIRYSGSPLPLSFSETNYPHQVLQVDFSGGKLADITVLRTPRPVPMLRVPVRPAPLDEVIAALTALQIDEAAPGLEPLLVVQVLASLAPTDMRARIEAALEGKRVRFTGIHRVRPSLERDADAHGDAVITRSLAELNPIPLFERLLTEHPDLIDTDTLRAAFAELLDQVHQGTG